MLLRLIRRLPVGGAVAAAMVGQSLGAGKPARAEQAVWTAAKYDVVFLGAIGVIPLAFTPQIVGLFTKDAAVATVAIYGLRVISLGFPMFAAGVVLEQSCNGAGDTRTPTWLNLFAFWINQGPLEWFLAAPLRLHEGGVFIAVTVAYSVLAAASAILFRRGRWKSKYV